MFGGLRVFTRRNFSRVLTAVASRGKCNAPLRRPFTARSSIPVEEKKVSKAIKIWREGKPYLFGAGIMIGALIIYESIDDTIERKFEDGRLINELIHAVNSKSTDTAIPLAEDYLKMMSINPTSAEQNTEWINLITAIAVYGIGNIAIFKYLWNATPENIRDKLPIERHIYYFVKSNHPYMLEMITHLIEWAGINSKEINYDDCFAIATHIQDPSTLVNVFRMLVVSHGNRAVPDNVLIFVGNIRCLEIILENRFFKELPPVIWKKFLTENFDPIERTIAFRKFNKLGIIDGHEVQFFNIALQYATPDDMKNVLICFDDIDPKLLNIYEFISNISISVDYYKALIRRGLNVNKKSANGLSPQALLEFFILFSEVLPIESPHDQERNDHFKALLALFKSG
ncbi:MAG: hypothetical protein Hyperionvirus1_32 [Hyperionvirus sp.]|uniref:Uncharacterized protein n=1 Tax=Hyperionvirus sp. TaxID=2487770 RepID=A0A3G5A9E5_9VIRU|nr:MAG: hypothetical protein Hyperionvirus1_32 [Hyperionvirus sp.]